MSLKIVATFGTLWEAGMAKSVLEAEGISALVEGETLHVIGYPVTPGFPDVRLLVNEEDLPRAEELLREWRESAGPADAGEDADNGA